jgi:hypothetical protein
MLLLKSTHSINNTLRFLITLPARLIMLNNYTRLGLIFVLLVVLTNKGFAQTGTGTCTDPIRVDLTTLAQGIDTVKGGIRSGNNCCGLSGNNCISYIVTLNPQTDMLAFNFVQTNGLGVSTYTVDCSGPYNMGESACVSGKTSVTISFCKPGNNTVDAIFTTSKGTSVSPDLNLRQGCTGSMTVTGMVQSSIRWTSIYPGTQGAYDSFLSATSAVATVNVTPGAGAPVNGFIEYQVTGTELSPCSTVTKSDTIIVHTYAPLTVALTSSNPTICAGSSVTLTATPGGGDPAIVGGNPVYTYLWSTGETTQSINVTTAGNYTVSVNDQSDQSATAGCGAITQSIPMTVTTPVAPSAPPVTICTGNTATLTASAPGGPYHWYDVNHNLVCSCTGASITTPALTTSTTYYVSTTYGGCQSPETAIPVTVSPLPATPSISSQ